MKKDDAKSGKQSSAAQGGAPEPVGQHPLERKVAELTEQLKKLTETAARAQADLQNAKIRMEKDGTDLKKYAAELTLLKLLPTIDNFQRAFRHLPNDIKDHQWVKGVATIEQAFMRTLGELGLRRFESLGRTVDTSRHEVLMESEGEKGKIIEVLEDGYELHGKLLRPAKVKVGSGTMDSPKQP